MNHPQSPSYLPTIFPDIYKKKKPETSQNQGRYERHLKRLNSSVTHCNPGNKKIANKGKLIIG
jgi:hypothetical protein